MDLQLQRPAKDIIGETKLMLYTTSKFGFLSLLVDNTDALAVLAFYDTLTIDNTFITLRPSIDSTDNSARETRMLRLMLPTPPNNTIRSRCGLRFETFETSIKSTLKLMLWWLVSRREDLSC
jgi:hypothetical protein